MADAARPNLLRRHPVWSWTIGVLLVLLVLGGWMLWRVATLASTVLELRDAAAVVADDLESGDLDALGDSLAEVRTLSASASRISDEFIVAVAAHQPVFGNEIQAVRTLSTSASDLTRAASPLIDALPRIARDGVVSDDGFNVDLLASLADGADALSTALTTTSARLDELAELPMIDAVAVPIAEVASAVDTARPTVAELAPFLEAMPYLLGANGDHTWFVAYQNLGETRASGGLLGGYIILNVTDGRLENLGQGSNDDLLAGPPPDATVVPGSFRDLWGDALDSWLSMNLSAHFPTTAQQIVGGWNARGEEQVDGVVALGQGVVGYLAAAVGDIEVDGRTFGADDLPGYLSTGIYEEFPTSADVEAKDAMVGAIIAAVFDKLSAGSFDIANVLEAALQPTTSDYLQLWSADANEQASLVAAGLSGSLSETQGPQSTVRVINGSGNKLDAYLQLSGEYTLGACTSDAETNAPMREGSATVTLRNDAPASGLPPYASGRLDRAAGSYTPGSNRMFVDVYAPVGARIVEPLGTEGYFGLAEERGHQYAMFAVELEPGESASVTLQWTEPTVGRDGGVLPSTPVMTAQPLLNRAQFVTPTAASCG